MSDAYKDMAHQRISTYLTLYSGRRQFEVIDIDAEEGDPR